MRLTPETRARAAAVAAEQQITLSEVLREAVEQYLSPIAEDQEQ